MVYTQSQWLLLFFLYCVAGWLWESLYVSAKERRWVNRGFLHGPWLPIYGTGAILILFTTLPCRESIPLTFLVGMVTATLLEGATGRVMEKMFHMRWWDYSEKPLNWKGYICLSVTVAWGFFSLLLVYILHPPMERLLLWVPLGLVEPLGLVLTVLFVVDATKSVQEALGLKSLMMRLSEHRPSPERLQTLLSYGKEHWRTRSLHRAMSILQRNPSAMSHHHREAFASLKTLKKSRAHKNKRA